ncbi:MAG: Lrp/AsnC family transcriptional regulator [Syntrophaceae bacterium]|nr:Lrp/AsnC family transcriptional regulator [Syntrophaceae bacterium]
MAHREDRSEQELFRQLQGDLPVEKRPFRAVASRAGGDEQTVLDAIRACLRDGTIRKFGAVLRHQRAGITRNAMVVWAVPPRQVEETGALLASCKAVTHCYERRPHFLGRYNLFTMIHAREGTIEGLVAEIAAQARIRDYLVLHSEEEFKKSSMEYY